MQILTKPTSFSETAVTFILDIHARNMMYSFPIHVKERQGHASYDNIEVQVKFTEFLRKLDGFKFYCIIGRKRLDIFHKRHNKNETEFYFDLIYHLTQNRFVSEDHFHQVLLSARHKSTQHKLKESIEKSTSHR